MSGPTAWSALFLTGVLLAGCGGSSATSPPAGVPSTPGLPTASTTPDVGLATLAPTSSPSQSAAAPTVASPRAAPSAAPTPTAVPAPERRSSPSPLTGTYVVAAGDTLWGIGQRYGLSVDRLLAANPQLTDRSLVRTGEQLTIPLHELAFADATLDLPSLPVPAAEAADRLPGCAQGKVTFSGGYALPRGGGDWWSGTWIEDVVRADVDGDGKSDVVALITCWVGEASFDRVVAFHHRADGTFATIGMIVQTDWVESDFDPNQIQDVGRIDATPVSGVVVTVDGLMCSCHPSFTAGVAQDRTYGWDGHAFVQTAGSTTFVVPPGKADLTVEGSISFGEPVDGVRAGTHIVTIRNNGASAVEDVSVLLHNYDWGHYARAVGRLDAGASATVTFRDSVSCRSEEECVDPFELQVRIGDQVYLR